MLASSSGYRDMYSLLRGSSAQTSDSGSSPDVPAERPPRGHASQGPEPDKRGRAGPLNRTAKKGSLSPTREDPNSKLGSGSGPPPTRSSLKRNTGPLGDSVTELHAARDGAQENLMGVGSTQGKARKAKAISSDASADTAPPSLNLGKAARAQALAKAKGDGSSGVGAGSSSSPPNSGHKSDVGPSFLPSSPKEEGSGASMYTRSQKGLTSQARTVTRWTVIKQQQLQQHPLLPLTRPSQRRQRKRRRRRRRRRAKEKPA